MRDSGTADPDISPATDLIAADAADPSHGRLEALRTRVPAWRHAQLTVTPLSGGMTNLNYLVIAAGASYVLRIGGNASDRLGIDREAEYAASVRAAALGIGPEVVAFTRPEGYLVTRFVEGSAIGPDLIRGPAVLARIVAALRRFHHGTPIPGSFSPFRVVERYARLAHERAVPLPSAYEPFREQARRMECALYPSGRTGVVLVPCHNDLLTANFLWEAGQLWIIDWEYAGMGDRYFDLANLSANHTFSEQDDHALLSAYFGLTAPDAARFARLQLMRGMSLFREAMWGVAQQGLSTIDFDFSGYTDRHFQLLEEWLARPDYEEWLRQASRPE
ncbi:MAG TPA: choline/ethanolamine kinase family protein [Chloroflexota bacterium]|nr:choline/ethanolamine kinase family protein [Chloroflexota bacterium]